MNSLRRSNGFTLIEVVISVSLLVLLGIIAMGALSPLLERYEKLERSKDAFVEQILSTRQIWEDLKLSYLSFNSLSVADDNGNDFFELYDDFPIALSNNISSLRQFTLALNARASFMFIVSDHKRGSNMLYDPVSAYSVDQASSPDQAATLSFVSLNQNDVITNKYPTAWRLDGLFMLYSPLRVTQSGASTTSYNAGHWPTYVGEINDEDRLIAVNANSTIRNLNPATNSAYTDEDEFLRTLPSAGGAAPMVFIQPIKIVLYFLRATTYKGHSTAALYKSEWVHGQFSSSPFLIGVPIKKVTFKRDSIVEPVISVDVEPDKF